MKRSGILFLAAIFVLGLCGFASAKVLKNPINSEQRGVSDMGVWQDEGLIAAKIERYYEIGLASYRRGEYAQALEAFQVVLDLDPEHRKTKEYAGKARAKLEERARGEEEASQMSKRRAERELISDIYNTGKRHMGRFEYEEAVRQFEKVLELEPAHQAAKKDLIKALGEREEQKKEGSEAEVMALIHARVRQESIAKRELTSYLSGHYKQARELFEDGQFEDAVEKFEEIEKIDPTYKGVQDYLADLRITLEVMEEQKRIEEEGYTYTLGPRDVLHLIVKDQPKMSGTITIQPAGELLLPVVNEIVMVNGLTKEQAREKIEGVLAKYVKDVSVQVIIAGYNSKKWYIIGEVGRKGEFTMTKPNLTLLEALYRAGLPVENAAAMGKVKLIKPHKTHPKYRSIDVYALLYQGKMEENVTIEPGDIIYVPKTMLRKVSTIASELSGPVSDTTTLLEDLESVLTIVPITRVGTGAGQEKYKKYPWPWSQ